MPLLTYPTGPRDWATSLPIFGPVGLAANDLADTICTAPSTTPDLSTPRLVTLAPTTTVSCSVPDSGANGIGPTDTGDTTIGDPSMFQFLSVADPGWIDQSADGIRFVVDRTAVPEPMSLTAWRRPR